VIDESVLFWALTLGGIAAAYTRNRDWYVDRLADCLVQSTTKRRTAVSSCLWWDVVCEEPALQIWEAARQNRKADEEVEGAADVFKEPAKS
jgi:hypothetical protein